MSAIFSRATLRGGQQHFKGARDKTGGVPQLAPQANPDSQFGGCLGFRLAAPIVRLSMAFREVEILLVEDNPDDEFLVLRALRKHKVSNKVHVVRDGEEALDFLFCRGQYHESNCAHNLKLILLDLKLPKINGLEVLAEIKSDPRTKSIPTVLLTSSSMQEEMLRAYVDGANSFLQKPVDFDHFDELIRQVGYYWMRINQRPDRDSITLMAEEPEGFDESELTFAEPVR
jgi:CheY-like chemotaxis protein